MTFKPFKGIKLVIIQGSPFDEVFGWEAGETQQTAAPVPLHNYAARMHLRPEPKSPVLLLELTTENGRIVLDPVAGTIRLKLNALETAAIDWDMAVFDLELIPAGREEDAFRFMQGSAVVSEGVTR